MFNFNYNNNETFVGPITEKNELTLDTRNFLKYASILKSNKRLDNDSKKKRIIQPLNEFMIAPTRFQYYDQMNCIGIGAKIYASQLAIQNIESSIVHQDIGYCLQNKSTENEIDKESARPTTTKKRSKLFFFQDEKDDFVSSTPSKHSDFMKKNSPQDTFSRILSMPIFNGNNTKTILQSNKSERYYQLTYPLENCGRMYVLAAPMLPCYSIIQPWSHVCRLFEINPLKPPSGFIVNIEETVWSFLKDEYNVKYVISLPSNISIMNRRDPVIQEGSIENISTIFIYDNCDADIQYNNPYGCFNKHEDYDGDTNTHGLGKGIESHVEINFNMKRQMLPIFHLKSIVPQNILPRVMFYFFDKVIDFRNLESDHILTNFLNNSILDNLLHSVKILYFKIVDGDFFLTDQLTLEMVLALELFRRVTYCVICIKNFNNLSTLDRIFQRRVYSLFYRRFIDLNYLRIYDVLRNFIITNLTNLYLIDDKFLKLHNDKFVLLEIFELVDLIDKLKMILDDLRKIWYPINKSNISNFQSLIDCIVSVIYCISGENSCTNFLNHLSYVTHVDYPCLFLNDDPFSKEYIINVLSLAKGNFDSLFKIKLSILERFNRAKISETLENSRSIKLNLGDRDIFERLSNGQIEKYIQYTDKYILGSKNIPKFCKQANSMKWALQNVIYYNGDLWIDDEIVLKDCIRYFSMDFFSDENVIDVLIDDSINLEKNL